MGKLPFFQFYPKDWLADTAILSNQAKGIYIDILSQLWLSETPGKRSWSANEFTTLLRLFPHEHDVEGPILELSSVCEIYFRDVKGNDCDFENCCTVTVISRRMVRDWQSIKARQDTQKRYYDRTKTQFRSDSDPIQTVRSQKSEVRIQEEDTHVDPLLLPEGNASESITVKELGISWNDYFTGKLPTVVLPLSPSRQKKAALRIREHGRVDFWQQVFENIERSHFLLGNGRGTWHVTFDWLIVNDVNCVKIWEGQYGDNKKAGFRGESG